MRETPGELGLPKKFKFWREGQLEAIDAVYRSDKEVFLLDAPTGIGKSVIGIGSFSKIATTKHVIDTLKNEEQRRYRCLYITRTKQLQDQITREFPMARTIKGRSNYPCDMLPGKYPEITAEDCQNDKSSNQRCSTTCTYKRVKHEALGASIAVLNDSYFLAEANGPGLFSGADLVILDEIDAIENALMSHIQMNVTERQLSRLQIKPPAKEKRRRATEWLGWADAARYEAQGKTKALQTVLEETDLSLWTDVELRLNRQLSGLQNFILKLSSFIQDVNDFWIFEYEDDTKAGWKATFKPVRVAEYSSKYLWQHGTRFLGMSGTIFDAGILANDLGIPDWDYSRLESPFPVENRPIYYNPLVDLKYVTMAIELPRLVGAVEEILSKYPSSRVLVHTVSYHVRDYLMANLSCQGRLMTHNSDNRDTKLEEFKASFEPLVMISPSFDRGVDLPNEVCRCVIICKIPYLNLSDRQVSARMSLSDGQRWYNLKAAQSLVQMSGRAVRSKDDYADTYILDRQFSSLLARTRHIIPKWWLTGIKKGLNVKE